MVLGWKLGSVLVLVFSLVLSRFLVDEPGYVFTGILAVLGVGPNAIWQTHVPCHRICPELPF